MRFPIFLRKTILFMLFLSLLTSCRLGEVLSEADPETDANFDPAEKEEVDSIVPAQKDELQTELKKS